MSFASLRNHALIATAGLATAVVLPLASATAIAPAANATTARTAVATAVVHPTAAQVAAKKKALAAAKKKRIAAAQKARLVARGKKIIKTAAKYKGRPYRYGAAGPRAFDCSGFTRYVVRKALHVSLPHNAAAQHYNRHVKRISKAHRKVGDLIFFGSGHGIYHVGIYAGHGMMWDAPHTGTVVHRHKIHGGVSGYGRIV